MEEPLPELPLEIWERIYQHAHLLFARKFMLRSKIRRKTEVTKNCKVGGCAMCEEWYECKCWTGAFYPSYIGPCESCRIDLDEAKRLLEEWSK